MCLFVFTGRLGSRLRLRVGHQLDRRRRPFAVGLGSRCLGCLALDTCSDVRRQVGVQVLKYTHCMLQHQ